MLIAALLAFGAGLLIGLSRQVNGRLSLSTSPLESSFWNHWVGFAAISVIALIAGLGATGAMQVPWYAYLGGPVGVLFIAASSWLIARIGAARMAILVIAGQSVSGVLLDVLRDAPGSPIARTAGVALILCGILWGRAKK